MHESRIAALEYRLTLLDQRQAHLNTDRGETERELETLRGIARRNNALADEAPIVESSATEQRERRRHIREARQGRVVDSPPAERSSDKEKQ